MSKLTKLFMQNKWLYWSFFTLFLFLLFFLQYYAPIKFHYLVPPGDDGANHLIWIKSVLSGNESLSNIWLRGGYPPGFFYLITFISKISHLDPLKILVFTYPALPILGGVSAFLFAYFLFGRFEALIVFLLYVFTANSPIQLALDGAYPNLLAAQILLPISFLLLIYGFLNKSKLAPAFGILAVFSVIFTHHISTFYLFALLSGLLLIFGLMSSEFKKWHRSFLVLLGIAIPVTLVLVLSLTNILNPIKSILAGTIELTKSFPFASIVGEGSANAIWPIASYPSNIGRSVSIFGVLAILFLPVFFLRNKKVLVPTVFLVFWAGLLLILSRAPFLNNPERLARDCVVPLSILAGIFIIECIRRFKLWPVRLGVILFLFLLVFLDGKNRLYNATHYEPMVRFTQADQEATQFLLERQKDGVLLARTYDPFLAFWLPGWKIDVSNTSLLETDDKIPLYDYIYVTKSQAGWLPDGIVLNQTNYYDSKESLTKVGEFTDSHSDIVIYKVIK